MNTIWPTLRRSSRQAVRSVTRHPSAFVALAGTLSLGITAAVAVFALVHAVLLRPLPYSVPQELVHLSSSDRLRGLLDRDISPPDFLDLAAESVALAQLGAVEILPAALTGVDEGARKIDVGSVTPSFFELLGIQPAAGRVFVASETGPSARPLLVLSESLAAQRFGTALEAVGAIVRVDGTPHEVIGVVRAQPPLPGMDVDAWVALPYDRSARRQAGVLSVIGRLGPGATIEATQSDLDRIGAALEAAYPDSNAGREFQVRSLQAALSAESKPVLQMLGLAVVLLLMITAVNASGLLIVRLHRRRSELAIRACLGASPLDVRGQLVVEGLILGSVAAVVSVGLAMLLLRVAGTLLPIEVAQLEGLSLGVSTALVAAGTALFVSLGAVGLAAVSTRSQARSPGGSRKRPSQVRALLLGSQIAATTVLVVTVALLGESLVRVLTVEPGFDPAQLVALAIDIPEDAYAVESSPSIPSVQILYDDLLRDVAAVPGVDAVALGMHHPLLRGWLTAFAPEGSEDTPVGEQDRVNLRAVSPGYFQVVGAQLREGRDVLGADIAESEPVVVVNQALARQYYPEGGAVGSRVRFFGSWWRVVGVVNDFKSHGLAQPTRPAVFASLRQLPSGSIQVLVRGRLSEEQLLQGTRDAIWTVDRQLAPFDLVSLDGVLASATADRRFVLWLFGSFGTLALILSSLGLATTVVESIETRRGEFGIRAALGASPQDLWRFAARGGVHTTVAGVAIGLVGALVTSRLLVASLYQVSPSSLHVYGLSAAAILILGAVATLMPARSLIRSLPRDLLGRTTRE